MLNNCFPQVWIILLFSPSLNEVVFQYVQAAYHLGKDKHPVATSLQFWQQLVNQYKLASSLDHCLELKIWRVRIVCFFKLFQNFLFSTCRDWTAICEYSKGFTNKSTCLPPVSLHKSFKCAEIFTQLHLLSFKKEHENREVQTNNKTKASSKQVSQQHRGAKPRSHNKLREQGMME